MKGREHSPLLSEASPGVSISQPRELLSPAIPLSLPGMLVLTNGPSWWGVLPPESSLLPGSRLELHHQAKVFTDALWPWRHITGTGRSPRWEMVKPDGPASLPACKAAFTDPSPVFPTWCWGWG